MNKTKKLTQGAMLLAIVGALMLIDRQLSFMFTEFIVMAIPVVIVIYACMYTVKDGGVLCFGLLALTFIFGTTYSYIYMPIAIIVGLGVSLAIKGNLSRRKMTIIAVILYVIGEVIATFVIYPLLGFDLATSINELKVMMDELNMTEAFNVITSDLPKLLVMLYTVSIVFVGVIEGYLTSLLTILLLKRLKIKDIGITNALDLKMSPITAYILFGAFIVSYFVLNKVSNLNDTLTYISICVSLVSSIALAYYGYIFISIYGKIRLGKKSLLFIILFVFLLFPVSYIVLMVLGFLYGAGPLRVKIEEMIKRKPDDNLNNYEKRQ